ncbi:MAG: archaeal flagellin [Halonotius sp. J07HN6]|nr:MAG: archaeal flagellin [Halonotius sp. J07HN6]ERH05216.1 MAG: archaeal flagellin [Halonotius sp. J07HN4]
MFSTDRRSQVGVGTLVVYLTMIVLTAVAAGVLISTAASLQAQAHQPGPTTQGAGDITATGATGHVESLTTEYDSDRAVVRSTDSYITELRVNVTGSPGSHPVNLTKAMVVYHAGNETRFLVHQRKADPAKIDASTSAYTGQGNSGFLISPVDAETPENALLTDPDDTYQLVIPLGIAYDIDAGGSPELQVATKNWGDSPAAVGSLASSKLFTGADADSPTASPYTLTDTAAAPLPGTPVDQVSFDNTYLNPIPAAERVQIDIVTANGSEATVVAGPATDLDAHDGEAIAL